MSRLIVSISHVEFTTSNETVYVIKVQQDTDEWELGRTYAEFRRLRDDLQRIMKDDKQQIVDDACSREFAATLMTLPFPAKRLFGLKKDHVLKERAAELHQFIIKLLLLTNTYRKAQKTLYDDARRSMASRPHGSASVFILLRDFLMPTAVLRARTYTNESTSSQEGRMAGEESGFTQRMLRESKMLAMRPSNHNKAMSAPQLHSHHSPPPLATGSVDLSTTTPVPRSPAARPAGGKTININRHTPSSAASAASVQSDDDKELEMAVQSMNLATNGSHAQASHEASPSASSVTYIVDGSSAPSASAMSTRRRPRAKKKNLSQAEKDQRVSERLSRLTPQLTAQTITIDAQKELERFVSEYNAIMVLRYVDRFIVKAVGKTPGCYTVAGKRLVIDSQRFSEELEEVFNDLPSNFEDTFKNATGEWAFPKALDAYVQMKWNSFQGKSVSSKSTNNHGSDSDDDSDSEYEYATSGGYMRTKKRDFSQEESDELLKMIADGTAGTDQMLRLRRQFDEAGWQRRNNPSSRQAKYTTAESHDEASDTDDEDVGSGSGNESLKQFQARQNAMRKSRLSRVEDVGGLV
ncbi:hypothetical protein Poli38472_005633 [Pythium oligandrum]|uniref:PX domain-containing protein n=1 Tax=Pythium oligandrum TaxID=41045 RepID=A0A8K1FGQ1_PYTOL|nr:hypothetical protein Poli38472_005633 [Pythium oligandrum]|eukprot:TMW63015.1 hypothetical protein Poli38472_005633 [Pythium oligandrum]